MSGILCTCGAWRDQSVATCPDPSGMHAAAAQLEATCIFVRNLEAERDELAIRLRSVEIVRDLMRAERDRLRGLLERALAAFMIGTLLGEEVRDALAEIRGDEAPHYRPPAPRPYLEQIAAALEPARHPSCVESCDRPGCAGGCRT